MSAAVVICKSKYPYALAHRRGEELLKEAKRMSKRLAAQYNEHHSVVTFEVILGNRLIGQEDAVGLGLPRPLLKPYWIVDENTPLSSQAERFGLDLDDLLEQRLKLRNVPSKRLHQIRRLFGKGEFPHPQYASEIATSLDEWAVKLARIIERSGHQDVLEAAAESLGAPKDEKYWRMVDRADGGFHGTGLLDLIQVWDFAQDLEHPLDKYEFLEEEGATS